MPRIASPYPPRTLAQYRADKACFGGDLLCGNAKTRRPVQPGKALHLILRSGSATGGQWMLRLQHKARIKAIVLRQAAHFGLRIFRYANGGNHLHIMVQTPDRASYRGFVRAIAGLIARAVTGAERGKAKGRKFWSKRPFTRIVSWGAAFRRCAHYILCNVLEAEGLGALELAQNEIRRWKRQGWQPKPG